MQSQQKTEFHLKGAHDFDKLFPELRPLFVEDEDLEKLALSMIENARCLDSKTISNGLGIFGQFLAHDITFEVGSKFRGQNTPKFFNNHRSYQLDLDSLYGQYTQDFLYNKDDRNKLLLGMLCQDEYGNCWYDLQRNCQEKAIIPDARNDENIIVSRIQMLFLQFHNCMVDIVRQDCRFVNVFEESRRRVIWHYHWLILHEYLKKIMHPAIFEDIVNNGPKYFLAPWFLPLEFTGAAFRTGHSQTRQRNRINEHVVKDLFELGIFEKMEDYVDWHYLFDFGDGKVQPAKLLDSKIEKIFHDLPFIKSSDPFMRSLPFRNLKRGVIYGLPSGEDVARRMCFEPIEITITRKLRLDGTPLWYYILKEAEVHGEGGEHLGPVGSTLAGEIFWALMANHDDSYLKVHPKWVPTIGREEGKFDFVDLINFVGEPQPAAQSAD
ncbi:MAG: hypothetical protein H6558_12170 [Lewinellaceae bacterium]|nr:hypothetical protein [Phaeodactylibacter sp.]MCB9265773.1 hypothetical protein [Lewinellaceae bacterium]MCB9352584.1 hypothetical protein [Lewinellaceae bacterium]